MALIECKGCGKQVSDKAETCPHCGKNMVEKIQKCEECGAELPEKAKTCPACGCPVPPKNPFDNVASSAAPAAETKKKKPIIPIIAAIVVILIAFFACSGGEENATTADENNATNEVKQEEVQQEETQKELTSADKFNWIQANMNGMDFTIPAESSAFILEHPDFFPGNENNHGAMSDYVDYEVSFQHISKSPTKYANQLISICGTVVDCEEITDEAVGTVTYIQLLDDYTEENYCLFYLGELENVFEDSWIDVYALPFSMTKFENMGGYYTEAVVCAAAYVDNLDDWEYDTM